MKLCRFIGIRAEYNHAVLYQGMEPVDPYKRFYPVGRTDREKAI